MRKKILFAIHSLKNKGGAERVACILANELIKDKDISIAVFEASKEPSYQLNEEIRIINLKGGNAIQKIISLRNLIKSHDLTIVHNMGRLSLLLSFFNILFRVKFISLEHTSFQGTSYYKKILKRIFYRNIQKIVTLTERDAKIYKKFHKSVYSIANPNTFNINEYRYRIDSRNLISIGRLTKSKGFDDLIEIWSHVEKHLPEWKLKIIGDGEERENLIKKIKQKKLERIFVFPAINKIETEYSQSAAFLMTSKYEGLPMVLLEAQCFSLPMIAFDCPNGPSEIISNNSNGFLITPSDHKKFAEKLIKICTEHHMREKFSQNSFINSKRFSLNQTIDKWNHLIEASLND